MKVYWKETVLGYDPESRVTEALQVECSGILLGFTSSMHSDRAEVAVNGGKIRSMDKYKLYHKENID